MQQKYILPGHNLHLGLYAQLIQQLVQFLLLQEAVIQASINAEEDTQNGAALPATHLQQHITV